MKPNGRLYRYSPGERVRMNGKSTSWLIRGISPSERYMILTSAQFGRTTMTVIDNQRSVMGDIGILAGDWESPNRLSPLNLILALTRGDRAEQPESDAALEMLENGSAFMRNTAPAQISDPHVLSNPPRLD